MVPFHLHFSLTRRQRLRVEVVPWLPVIAGATGFGLGALFLATSVSVWCLFLLLLPVLMYRGLFVFAFDLIVNGGRSTDLVVDADSMEVRSSDGEKCLPLDGIFQVFRTDDTWTVLHLDGTVLTIPTNAITVEQVDYLRVFAHRCAAMRADAQS